MGKSKARNEKLWWGFANRFRPTYAGARGTRTELCDTQQA
jgi:hypothetical protein